MSTASGYYEPIFKNIKELIIPNTITHIGYNAFAVDITDRAPDYGIKGTLYIPNSVVSVGGHAFIGNNIEKLVLSNKVRRIELGAFQYNDITEVILPNTIEFVGKQAFYMNKVVSVYIPDNGVLFGDYVFTGNGENRESDNITNPGRWIHTDNGWDK